jgi:hypothetical protein
MFKMPFLSTLKCSDDVSYITIIITAFLDFFCRLVQTKSRNSVGSGEVNDFPVLINNYLILEQLKMNTVYMFIKGKSALRSEVSNVCERCDEIKEDEVNGT